MEAHRCWNASKLNRDQSLRAVIFDSNFLFIPYKFNVDIFDEIKNILGANAKCMITKSSLNEIKLLKCGANPSFLKEVNYALKLTDNCEIIDDELRPEETVDEAIMRTAFKMKLPVATNDAELRKKMKKAGITVIFLRQRSFLEIDGPLI